MSTSTQHVTAQARPVGQGATLLLNLPRTRRLSIGMVGLRGVPATYGGIERHVEEVGARLVERGHAVTVYCRNGYADERPETHRGMQLRHLPSVATKHLEAITHTVASAARALSARHDIVHFHALGPGLVSPFARALGDCSVVQTVHGLDGRRAKWGPLARRVLDVGERVSARVPDATLVVSEALAAHYQSVHGRTTTVTANGVTPQPREPLGELADEYGLTPGSYVLYVGRLVPEKRADLLLEAYRQIDTDKRLVIAGGNSFSDSFVERLHAMAAQDPRVSMVGYVYDRRLRALYSNAAAFVLPSDLEGQPLTLLEAASFGVPIVASDIAPVTEVISSTRPGSLVFEAGNPDALRGQLSATLDAGDAARAGAEELRRRVLDDYSWDAVTDRVEHVYLQLRAGNDSPAYPVDAHHLPLSRPTHRAPITVSHTPIATGALVRTSAVELVPRAHLGDSTIC